jgi:hypothetical protein
MLPITKTRLDAKVAGPWSDWLSSTAAIVLLQSTIARESVARFGFVPLNDASVLLLKHRDYTPSKDAPKSFRTTEPQQRVFHPHGWAAGPCELRRKSRVTCLESMNLSNGLSSQWVGHRPWELISRS